MNDRTGESDVIRLGKIPSGGHVMSECNERMARLRQSMTLAVVARESASERMRSNGSEVVA